MPSERHKLRVAILTEDKMTERFVCKLLRALGFDFRKFIIIPLPNGKGSGEAWVAKQYPREVKALRSRNYQHSLRLISVRDSDTVGLKPRKKQLDKALLDAGLPVRQANEGIATPVPSRNIETWLLALMGQPDLNEATNYKGRFKKEHGAHEASAAKEAVEGWKNIDETSLPSLQDGKTELERLGP